ncbi:hypothetical protein [Arcobacter sp. LA11]|uniref:hypothetical protein n=1 Tax=Arcobacter sp. LA11 TaxID=1898176 RepID=UPI000932F56F|nr:hypothetical protein [Arcobacter sp. LA11]
MNLILITKTPMVEKIFTLICKKLNINILVKDDLNIENSVDFIIVDEEFVNDDFNSLKQKTKKIAAITSEELPFDKSRDFIINRPFLPTALEVLLSEQMAFIEEDNQVIENPEKDINEEELMSNYVESLADDVAYNIEEESDESIVTIASVNNGGVLDNTELHKISDILHDDDVQNEVTVDENDWKDISEIIDDALNEVSDYEFDMDSNEPIKLILNNYNISELKPFLQKFDQNVIDRLSNGEDVDVTLSLKVNK